MPNNPPNNKIDQQIIQTVKKTHPQTVEQLIQLIKPKTQMSNQQILNHILKLQQNQKIRLKPPKPITPRKFTGYLLSNQAVWYWLTVILASATTVLVFTVSETMFPLIILRYILGSIFILWLPGYTLIKTLFPTKQLDPIERTALSIGTSLALVPLTGLLLNYTPWGIRTTPITLSLLTLTLILATAAAIREHTTNLTQKQT